MEDNTGTEQQLQEGVDPAAEVSESTAVEQTAAVAAVEGQGEEGASTDSSAAVSIEPSRRDLLAERLKAKNPDKSYDNDDDLYSDLDSVLDALGNHERDSAELADLFRKNPKAADFFVAMKDGEDPMISLIRMFGDEFKEALDDPDMLDKMSEARAEWVEKVAKSKELEDLSASNLEASLNSLDEVAKKYNLDESQVTGVYELFTTVVNDAIVNKISLDTWELFYKAKQYDLAVAEAAHMGEVAGRNAKIEEKKGAAAKEVLPQLPNTASVQQAKKEDNGFFSKTAEPDIFERGKRH